MNLLSISLNYIAQKKLNTFLNTLLLALGVGIIVFLLLVQFQLQEKFTNNVKGIKMVVGAKGSPLQLILCNVYHIDYPTGNIPLIEALKISNNKRFVRKSIPLALGDSYKGFRIIGTTQAYPKHYQVQISSGKLWEKTLEVTIGAEVAQTLKLKIGSTFAGAHGLEDDDVNIHTETAYRVVGILKKSNTVIDRVILTNIESVWAVHESHEEEKEEEHKEHHTIETYEQACADTATTREITSLLITDYSNPIAAINLPRVVNQIGVLQAAAPALEVNRLFELIGVGEQALQIFAAIIILIAMLSIFIALLNALKERQYDLAIMRTLGATQSKLFLQIILEGFLLTFLGLLLGFALGHGVVAWIGTWEDVSDKVQLSSLIFLQTEFFIALAVLLIGLIASLIPAFQVYRVDISKTLSS